MYVDQEFYDYFKSSGIPSPLFTKRIIEELKANKRKNNKNIEEVFRI